MIITRTPLRICLGGGGTDVKEYYAEHGGYVISAALNQYIYIVIHNSFDKSIRVCYSKREIVDSADQVHHPVVREAMKLLGITETGIEIISFADVPSETGLGSSSSFTVGLLTGLAAYKGLRMTKYEIAEMAVHIERELLKEAGGKQDQYIAAFGGITAMDFHKDGKVTVSPVQVSHETVESLEKNILLFYTGIKRSSYKVQRALVSGVKKETRTLDSLHEIKRLGHETETILRTGTLDKYAEFLRQHWEAKQKLSDMVTNGKINQLYRKAMDMGALGGKIIGAGGGGYLLLYCSDPLSREKIRAMFEEDEIQELKYSFDFNGTSVVVDDGVRNKHRQQPALV